MGRFWSWVVAGGPAPYPRISKVADGKHMVGMQRRHRWLWLLCGTLIA